MGELLEAAGFRLARRPVRASGVLPIDDGDAAQLLGVGVRIKVLVVGQQLALCIVLLVGCSAGSHAARLFRLSILVEHGRLHPGVAPTGRGGIASSKKGLFGLWVRLPAVTRDRNRLEKVEVIICVWSLLVVEVDRDDSRLPVPEGGLVGTCRVPGTLLGLTVVTPLANSCSLVVEPLCESLLFLRSRKLLELHGFCGPTYSSVSIFFIRF